MEENFLDSCGHVLMYGDRVELDWTDANGKTIRTRGLFGGRCDNAAPDKVIVTLTDSNSVINTTKMITQPQNLTFVEHPVLDTQEDAVEESAGEAKSKDSDKVLKLGESKDTAVDNSTMCSGKDMEDSDKTPRKWDRLTLMAMRDKIMDNFDFEKVHQAMEALGWGWAGLGDDPFEVYVPELSQIKDSARKQMNDIIYRYGTDREYTRGGTGGFEVSLSIDPDTGNPDLELRFVLTEWYESYDESESCSKEYSNEYTERLENGGPVLPIWFLDNLHRR